MGRETIRDNNNRTLGYIQDVAGGKLKAMDASLRTIAYYDPRSNKTHDPSYRTIAKGNVLSALIYKQCQNELGGSGQAKVNGDSGATQSGSCSAAIGFIVLAVLGAIYHWWGEGLNRDETNAIVNPDQQIDQSSSEADSSIPLNAKVANSPSRQGATLNPPKEDEVRGAIIRALDTGAAVRWTVGRRQSGWVAVSASTETTGGSCRTVAVTDDQHRSWDTGRVWCRRSGGDWQP